MNAEQQKDRSPIIAATQRLATACGDLVFGPPVTHVYNPLQYAWEPHQDYLERYGCGVKRVLFMGMNPGPFGMVQTGIPFGEVSFVRDWLGISGQVKAPMEINPHRPVEGFACKRSEVSGRRLWGLFQQRFQQAEVFFDEYFVINYCPLAFFAGGRNVTPDKLSPHEVKELFACCDSYLRQALAYWQPEWLIGVGGFAAERAKAVVSDHFVVGEPNLVAPHRVKVGQILHPSPANPQANQGWAEKVTHQLSTLGVW